jgi:hypothetical protein
LAEKSYAETLNFLRAGKFSVLENKVLLEEKEFWWRHQNENEEAHQNGKRDMPARGLCLTNHLIAQKKLNFLLCGTFTPTYGTLEGIRFFKKMQTENPQYQLRLQLVGYAPDAAYRKSLKAELSLDIEWIGGEKPVAHASILAAMQEADVLLLPYAPNPSTANCFPTKCYEACALQLPMLMQQNPFWEAELSPYKAAFFIDFFQENYAFAFDDFLAFPFYPKAVPSSFWSWEAEKLRRVMASFS